MKIQVDGVAYEFILRATAMTFYDPEEMPDFDGTDDQAREFALMASLESAVIMGAMSHHFDARRKVDVFQATSRLIQHWSWMFPGDQLEADCEDMRIIKLSGRRSRHFTKEWAMFDASDPPPAWPS